MLSKLFKMLEILSEAKVPEQMVSLDLISFRDILCLFSITKGNLISDVMSLLPLLMEISDAIGTKKVISEPPLNNLQQKILKIE